ncbi:MAG: sortase [Candidatus Saccharibacteria bacterium]|nr:sortase [Candidatus Saccharibacteria bacterium]
MDSASGQNDGSMNGGLSMEKMEEIQKKQREIESAREKVLNAYNAAESDFSQRRHIQGAVSGGNKIGRFSAVNYGTQNSGNFQQAVRGGGNTANAGMQSLYPEAKIGVNYAKTENANAYYNQRQNKENVFRSETENAIVKNKQYQNGKNTSVNSNLQNGIGNNKQYQNVVENSSEQYQNTTAGVQTIYAKAEKDTNSSYKETPINVDAQREEWQKYHSAWQNYYQNYYNSYYTKAAEKYVSTERQSLADERKKLRNERAGMRAMAMAGAASAVSAVSADEKEEIEEDFKARIQKIAKIDKKKREKRRKFIPLILGVVTILVLLFLQYNRLIFAPIMAYISPGNSIDAGITEVDPTVAVAVSPNPKLIIPKLNIDVPVIFGITATDTNAVMNAMNADGVVHFRIAGASAYPGENGNFVITGHSAGDVYSNNPYKFIFSGLERLSTDDKIYMDFEGVRYTYAVREMKTIEPSDISALQIGDERKMLTLITCWPLGTSRYRLLVIAEQINPTEEIAPAEDPGAAEPEAPVEDNTEALPENEKTFFEGVWDWLTK